ncbi:MAG: hypothetical protein VXV96_07360 [Bdellovibrionota bacterium]|nr:hypothetical protein [Bdellovibrionota bacterium]
MKTRTFFLLLSGALFLAALVYSVMDRRVEDVSFLQVQKSFDRERPSLYSREIEKQGGIVSDPTIKNSFNSQIKLVDTQLLALQKRECQFAQEVFEKNPDYIDSQSEFYKNELKMKDKAEYMFSAYFSSLMAFKDSIAVDYQKVRRNPGLSDKQSWRDVEETFSGCAKEADIGLFMLTLAETIKSKRIKKWFLIRALKMAKAYLNFGTITGQIYAVGLLKNLVISKQVKGYLVHELYSLGEDVDRQAFQFRETLHNTNDKEVIGFLILHENRKREFDQRLRDIMEEILLKSES